MNVLVLSDNKPLLDNARPIFEKRKVKRWTFTDSDSINPKKDFKHILDNYDLVFSLHCKKIFPEVLTTAIRCVNIHPGFNPYNRGIYPHVFSIVNGLPAGATIHEMTPAIDSGPIIGRIQVDVLKSDTSTSLYKRVLYAELLLLDLHLDAIIKGVYHPIHAMESQGNYNSMADFKKLCEFNPTFQDTFNKLRALSHAGYMNATYNGIKFKLIIADENINTPND